ncbi:MAG TPA: hypothetical protein VIX35_05690, partial [Vicinamibacterales bacterium]
MPIPLSGDVIPGRARQLQPQDLSLDDDLPDGHTLNQTSCSVERMRSRVRDGSQRSAVTYQRNVDV